MTADMEQATVERLLSVNRTFYARFAEPFLQTRRRPQPGFWRLLDFLPKPCRRLLDVGCADGRLGRFLFQEEAIEAYTGVDFSEPMLEAAPNDARMRFVERDLVKPQALEHLGRYDAVTCLATLQHIPGYRHRVGLLASMGERVRSRGPIIVSTWQFLENERQRRKIVRWVRVGLQKSEVGEDDYLLTWKRNGEGLRYVCFIDLEEMRALASASGLELLAHFRSDGREGDLNLYTVLAPVAAGQV